MVSVHLCETNCGRYILTQSNLFFITEVIAVCSPRGNFGEGTVTTLKYNNISNQWDSYGTTIYGAGYSTSLSYTGSTIAVGFPRATNSDGLNDAGRTDLYSMNGSEWQLSGKEIYGESGGNLDGVSVAMSRDGNFVVIGGRDRSEVNSTTGETVLEFSGHCSVYQLQANGTGWELKGSIRGEVAGERLGTSVSISLDGSIVACGGIGGMNDNSQKSGVVRLWNRVEMEESTIWPQGQESDLEGAAFGASVSMASDGEHLLAGAPTFGSSNEASSEGAIQIFRYSATYE